MSSLLVVSLLQLIRFCLIDFSDFSWYAQMVRQNYLGDDEYTWNSQDNGHVREKTECIEL